MPRKSVYPDWVRNQIEPGYSPKRVGDKYYLYKTTSKLVKGKKNPQPYSEYVGVITPNGIKYSNKKIVDTDIHPEWYEYGFSKCLYDVCLSVMKKEFPDEKMAENVTLNIIRQLSPRSYLLKGKNIPDAKELGICVCNQKKKIEEKRKIRFEDFNVLKDILLIEINKRTIITAATAEQIALAKKLEVGIYE